MVLKADRERVKALLTETITLLCKNGLNYQSEFAIEALIGITLDRDDVFLVSIKETICSDLGIDKGYDLHDDRQDDRREFHIETTRTSRVEATRISQEVLKDGLESAPDLSIMVQLDKSDDGRLEDTPNGSSALVPQKLFRSMHADNSSMDMADSQERQSCDSKPSSFGMHDFDTGTSTTGRSNTSHREHSTDRSDHIQQPSIKRQRTDDSGDRSVKEEEDSDDDVVLIKEEAGLDTLSCQMDAYNRTGMFDTSGSVSHDAIRGMTLAEENVLPHTLTLSSSAPVFPGCSSWDQLPAISAQHSLPPSTASSNTTMSNTPSQQMSQTAPFHSSDSVFSTRRNHTCLHCGKKFAGIRFLHLHEAAHRGDYPYRCDICGKGCVTMCDLKRHITTHAGVRDYKCSECTQEFTRACSLKRHVRNLHQDK